MRVSSDTMSRLQELLAQRASASEQSTQPAGSKTPAAESKESVQESVEMRLVTVLHQIAVQAEPIDVERVLAVSEQIQNGSYGPDAKAVAEAIMQELGGQ